MEGEDHCSSPDDFTVDLADRGMDSDETDGTDWGADDSAWKCGTLRAPGLDGWWAVWVREQAD